MTRQKRVDFHVVNALGTTLGTFDSLDLAKSWVRRHVEHFPSLRVERVEITITRELAYRPRQTARPKRERIAA